MAGFISAIVVTACQPSPGFAHELINPTGEALGSDFSYLQEEYCRSLIFDARRTNNISENKCPTQLKFANEVWFDKPKAVGCEYCQADCDAHDGFTAEISIEKSDGSVISAPGYVLANLDGNFDVENVCLRIKHRPGRYCSYCKKYVGDVLKVPSYYVEKTYIRYQSHPQSVTADAGSSVSFEVIAGYNGPYKWVRKEGRNWVELKDGPGSMGESYSGTNTYHLDIKNISGDMNGQKFACRLVGAWGYDAYTKTAVLTVPVVTTVPTPSPSPTPVITPVVTPTPAVTPVLSPTPVITPAITPTPVVTQVPTPVPTQAPRSSSSSSSSSKGGGSHSGEITPIPSSSTTPIITPGGGTDTKGGGGSTSKPGSGTKKGASGGGTSAKETASNATSTSSSSSKIYGKNAVMKNGILYLVDDDTDQVSLTSSSAKNEQEHVEEVSNDMEYSAGDLAVEGTLQDKQKASGFWNSWQGYVTIGGISVSVLLALLFFLFFGVIVTGEAEENDEVFELCSIRLMKRKDGNWCVNLGSAFDENAVLKLRIGILFSVIFDGWEITGYSKGMYEGEITAQVEQNMMLRRRNIRRSV